MSRGLFICLLGLLFGCGKDIPTLEGVDAGKWKSDKNGCSGIRQSMESAIRKENDKLKGLSEMDIVGLLGRPDENELYKRNQKFFYYYVSRGPACPAADTTSIRLVIRFNAMGYAQLTSVE